MISHLSLQKKTHLSHSVTLQSDSNGYEFLVIDHQKFKAAFALQGAHLIDFQLKEQPPIIWLSKTALYSEGKAIRGGVPICWPWFGAADAALGDNLPAHGFARSSLWSVRNINELTNGVEIELLLKDSEKTRAIWPYPFELILKATLTDTLTLALISKNTGERPFSYTGALHTYLNISAPQNCHISGLNKCYADKLNAGQLCTAKSPLPIDRPIDAIHQKSTAVITLHDSGFKRQLHIANSGNDCEVVWTPWIEGAHALADMPDDGYQTMICIESAITNADGQSLTPGETHTLSTSIHC